MSHRIAFRIVLVLVLCAAARSADAVPRTVVNTIDSGAGSLRAALTAATAGDVIDFAIPGDAVHTISPLTALPPLAAGVTIDATGQTGANCATWPPSLRIEIDGGSTSAGTHGLTIAGDGVVVRGLVVNSFPADGIHFQDGAKAATIECNFIGSDATGTLDYGNGAIGIALQNSDGTLIDRNLVSANAVAGVAIDAASSAVSLRRNYIGTNAAGTAILANYDGVVVEGSGNTIGGIALGNVISGNAESGVAVAGPNATGNVLYGNKIGSNAAGNQSLPNAVSGVFLFDGASQNTIGSIAAGTGNLLRENGAGGVWLSGDDTLENSIRGNSMLRNGQLGIELDDVLFENPNDPGDPDAGSNRLQNTPELVDVTFVGNQVTGSYSVSTDPVNATYPLRIDFYIAAVGSEQGETYLGTTTYSTTDFATGEVSQVFTAVAPLANGQDVTATATDSAGNTSEFTAIAITATPEPGALAGELAAVVLLAFRRDRHRHR